LPKVAPGITPEKYAGTMIRAYLQCECKGKKRKIGQSYVERSRADTRWRNARLARLCSAESESALVRVAR
jgi:hypothetical protein